jgi:hypothetical protein
MYWWLLGIVPVAVGIGWWWWRRRNRDDIIIEHFAALDVPILIRVNTM